MAEIFRKEARYASHHETEGKLLRGEMASQAYDNYRLLVENTRVANDRILAARRREQERREEQEAHRRNRHMTALQLQGFNRRKDHERAATARAVRARKNRSQPPSNTGSWASTTTIVDPTPSTASQPTSTAAPPEVPPRQPPAEKTLTKVMPQSQPAVPPVPLRRTLPTPILPSTYDRAKTRDATMMHPPRHRLSAATLADDLDESGRLRCPTANSPGDGDRKPHRGGNAGIGGPVSQAYTPPGMTANTTSSRRSRRRIT